MVAVGAEIARVAHAYPHAVIDLRAFACTLVAGQPQPLDCWEVGWVEANDLLSYEMPEADIPIAKALARG